MPLTDMNTFLKKQRLVLGEERYARRKEIAVLVSAQVEEWLKGEEGKLVEPDTEGAIQFYRRRVLWLLMALGDTNAEKMLEKEPLIVCHIIQEMIKKGIMI